MAKSFRKSARRIPPNGTIRKSQIVSTFGPGAMVDLVDDAVLIGGLDFWSFQGSEAKIIVEPRLREAVRKHLGDDRPLNPEGAFRERRRGMIRIRRAFRGSRCSSFRDGWCVRTRVAERSFARTGWR